MDEIERELREQEQNSIQRDRDERIHTHPTGCPEDCDCTEDQEADDD